MSRQSHNRKEWVELEAEIGRSAERHVQRGINELINQNAARTRWDDFDLDGQKYDDLGWQPGEDNVQDYLKMRRYFLGLFFLTAQKGIPNELPDVHSHRSKKNKASKDKLDRIAWLTWLLYKTNLSPGEDGFKEALKEFMKGPVTNMLTIKGTELPDRGILLEERRWLEDLGIDLALIS